MHHLMDPKSFKDNDVNVVVFMSSSYPRRLADGGATYTTAEVAMKAELKDHF